MAETLPSSASRPGIKLLGTNHSLIYTTKDTFLRLERSFFFWASAESRETRAPTSRMRSFPEMKSLGMRSARPWSGRPDVFALCRCPEGEALRFRRTHSAKRRVFTEASMGSGASCFREGRSRLRYGSTLRSGCVIFSRFSLQS